MRKLTKLRRIAERITGYHPREITSNFSYFVKRSIDLPSNYSSTGLSLFTCLVGILFYLNPSVDPKSGIVYMPKIYLRFEGLSTNFLVHEMLHLKFPSYSEFRIIEETSKVLEGYHG